MSETDNNAQGQEMHTSKLAKAALVWSICSGIVLFIIASFYTNYAWGLLPLTGLALGVVSLYQIKKSRGRLVGYPSAILATGISFIFVTLIAYHGSWGEPTWPSVVICGTNLSGLGKAMKLYANDFDGKHPTAEKWCDSLIKGDYVTLKQFVCPGSGAITGESSFALNVNVVGRKRSEIPSDVVLLFETSFGIKNYSFIINGFTIPKRYIRLSGVEQCMIGRTVFSRLISFPA